MKYGSVCSGIEAATVAWHPLGWKPSFFSEIEKFPRDVLAHHYPHVPLHGDFTTIQKGDYEPIELLVGETPCQSFSVAGLRAGLNDPRGNLMLEFGALAKRLHPKWLVWENVPGVLSSNCGKDFGSFLAMLAELGYGFAYRVLDAQHFGVPQRRRRVFVVGCLGDWRSAAAVLFERHSLQGHPAPRREKRQEVTDIAGTLTSNCGGLNRPAGNANELDFCVTAYREADLGNFKQDEAIGTLKAHGDVMGGGSESLLTWPADTASTLNSSFGSKLGLENQHINSGAPLFVPAYGIPGNWINRKPENGGNATEPMLNVAPCQTKTDVHAVAHVVHGTQDPCVSDVAFAQGRNNGGENVLFQHMAVRRLTPVECERLQGFPDNYTNIPKAADSNRYKALGNSMAVPVMHWIGSRIADVDAIISPVSEAAA